MPDRGGDSLDKGLNLGTDGREFESRYRGTICATQAGIIFSSKEIYSFEIQFTQ